MISLKQIIDWIVHLFKKSKTTYIPVIIPESPKGSPNWTEPTYNNPSANWQKYISLPYNNQEIQLGLGKGYYELENCTVEFSIEMIQMLLNWYIQNRNDIVSTYSKALFCNPQGYVKLSARFSSIMSGITLAGADAVAVCNQYEVNGFVPETMLPDPPAPFTWEQYMTPPPNMSELIALGKKTAEVFQVLFRFLPNNGWGVANIPAIQTALQTSPVGFVANIGTVINGIEQPNPEPVYQHCRLIYNVDNYFEVEDNYSGNGNFLEKLTLNSPMPFMAVCSIKLVGK